MIKGHGTQKEYLENIAREKRTGGFLLCGPEGVGKYTLIQDIAHMHTDAAGRIFIDAKKQNISKQTADIIRSLSLLRSQVLRMIVINDAHTMGRDGQNTLLKILEETPSMTAFFFVSHRPLLLLPTIRSRLHSIRFGLLDIQSTKEILKEKECKDVDIRQAVKLYAGQPGKALSYIDQKDAFSLFSKYLQEEATHKKLMLCEKMAKILTLPQCIEFFMQYERKALREGSLDAARKLSELLELYYDAASYLHPVMHIQNLCLKYMQP